MASLAIPLCTALAAMLMARYLAPILISAALRYGIVDRPVGPLKEHGAPVPYLGGLVVFLAFLFAIALTLPFESRVLAILLMASLLVAVGLVDDLGTLTPRDKIIGQLVAAFMLVKAGVKIELVITPFPLDEALSILWLLTCMNAMNIIDVSDGLATTAGAVGASGAFAIAWVNDEFMIATLAASLLGALLGFLAINRQPARMYLGDTGSLLIGGLLGALALIGRYSESNDVAPFFAPLTLLALPLFDLVLVIVARARAKVPIYQGSRDHFAIRLRDHGVSARATARAAALIGTTLVALGIASLFVSEMWAWVLSVSALTAGIAALGWFLLRLPPRPILPASAAYEPPP